MSQFTPDYEHLYMQEKLADVKLVIKDENEAAAAGQKRKRKSTARTLPGHGLLLLGHSGYCKAKVRLCFQLSPSPQHDMDVQLDLLQPGTHQSMLGT